MHSDCTPTNGYSQDGFRDFSSGSLARIGSPNCGGQFADRFGVSSPVAQSSLSDLPSHVDDDCDQDFEGGCLDDDEGEDSLIAEYDRLKSERRGLDCFEAHGHFGFLKVPHSVMRETGPAAQTFGLFIRTTNRRKRESFISIEKFTRQAEFRLKTKTCRNHFSLLRKKGFLDNKGR